MKKTFALLLSMMMVVSIVLTGCGDGNNKKLEAAIKQQQDQIDSIDAAFGDAVELEVTVRGDAIVFSCTLKEEIEGFNKETAEASLESMAPAMQQEMLAPLQKEVKDVSIIFEFFDVDGKEIISKEFK